MSDVKSVFSPSAGQKYDTNDKKTLPSLLPFLRLSLPKPIWKKVLHVWYQNDGKTACALSVHSRFGAFGLIPGPLGGIILTGVHLIPVFSNKGWFSLATESESESES